MKIKINTLLSRRDSSDDEHEPVKPHLQILQRRGESEGGRGETPHTCEQPTGGAERIF